MKTLESLLIDCKPINMLGNIKKNIEKLAFDSRAVIPDTLFFAVRGTQNDGHRFIDIAIEKGATAIVCEEIPETTHENIAYIQVKDSSEALAFIAATFYDYPSKKLKLLGVTGTNGKTTVATLSFRLFRSLGYKCGLISTVENRIEDTVLPAKMTTPDALTIQELMTEMVAQGCTHCFMEASSHAIVQNRVAGLDFDVAVFTNITHDHLDYHKTFDNYIAAKKKLFDDLPAHATAITNIDDKRGLVMLQNTKAKRMSYALKADADFKARILADSFDGLQLFIENKEVWFRLIGLFNAYNLMAIYGAAVVLGEEKDVILTHLSKITAATGRFEQIVSKDKKRAIVDYAHTPDALENVLQTIHEIRQRSQQIITVVGCGGDRDKTKRPEMAKIAVKMSDIAIFTSDNPRSEEPQAILDDMLAGLSIAQQQQVIIIADRKEAIKTAIRLAKPDDIILVAGKGHENYQEIKGVKYDFDDRTVVTALFQG
jgi:UDP-N-acetylmuramoyl-L-alanyl-D-glutamate--2,6-diaminopimelate ligase